MKTYLSVNWTWRHADCRQAAGGHGYSWSDQHRIIVLSDSVSIPWLLTNIRELQRWADLNYALSKPYKKPRSVYIIYMGFSLYLRSFIVSALEVSFKRMSYINPRFTYFYSTAHMSTKPRMLGLCIRLSVCRWGRLLKKVVENFREIFGRSICIVGGLLKW